MRDVARRSGVSVATVSNVLHNTAPVAEPTRLRVLEAIEQLGYRQNEVARSLKRRTTHTLGVSIPDSLNPFHATLALEVERRAHRDGFAVLVAETENDPETEIGAGTGPCGPACGRGHLPGRDRRLGNPQRAARPRHPGGRRVVRRTGRAFGHHRGRRVRRHGRGGRAPALARPSPHCLRPLRPARGAGGHPSRGAASGAGAARPGAGRRRGRCPPQSAAPTTWSPSRCSTSWSASGRRVPRTSRWSASTTSRSPRTAASTSPRCASRPARWDGWRRRWC